MAGRHRHLQRIDRETLCWYGIRIARQARVSPSGTRCGVWPKHHRGDGVHGLCSHLRAVPMAPDVRGRTGALGQLAAGDLAPLCARSLGGSRLTARLDTPPRHLNRHQLFATMRRYRDQSDGSARWRGLRWLRLRADPFCTIGAHLRKGRLGDGGVGCRREVSAMPMNADRATVAMARCGHGVKAVRSGGCVPNSRSSAAGALLELFSQIIVRSCTLGITHSGTPPRHGFAGNHAWQQHVGDLTDGSTWRGRWVKPHSQQIVSRALRRHQHRGDPLKLREFDAGGASIAVSNRPAESGGGTIESGFVVVDERPVICAARDSHS